MPSAESRRCCRACGAELRPPPSQSVFLRPPACFLGLATSVTIASPMGTLHGCMLQGVSAAEHVLACHWGCCGLRRACVQLCCPGLTAALLGLAAAFNSAGNAQLSGQSSACSCNRYRKGMTVTPVIYNTLSKVHTFIKYPAKAIARPSIRSRPPHRRGRIWHQCRAYRLGRSTLACAGHQARGWRLHLCK